MTAQYRSFLEEKFCDPIIRNGDYTWDHDSPHIVGSVQILPDICYLEASVQVYRTPIYSLWVPNSQ